MQKEPGRNDPCWCGSGKKYKKCHGAESPAPKGRFSAKVLTSGSYTVPTPTPVASLGARKITMLSQRQDQWEMPQKDYHPPHGELPPMPEPFGPKEQPPATEKESFDPDAEFKMVDTDYRPKN